MRLYTWGFVCCVLLCACDDEDGLTVVADAGPPDAMIVPNLDRTACVPDESAAVPADRCGTATTPPCRQWVKVDVEGAVCSNGSQYKIFVNYSNTSNNLEVHFEGGGACWDYPSCSGAGGRVQGGQAGTVGPSGYTPSGGGSGTILPRGRDVLSVR